MKTVKKKTQLERVVLLGVALFASATVWGQTNVQEMYDFNRGHLVTTVEAFHADPGAIRFFSPTSTTLPTSMSPHRSTPRLDAP